MKPVFVVYPFSSFNELVSELFGTRSNFSPLRAKLRRIIHKKKQQRTLEGCESLKPTTSTSSSSKVESKVVNVPWAVISS